MERDPEEISRRVEGFHTRNLLEHAPDMNMPREIARQYILAYTPDNKLVNIEDYLGLSEEERQKLPPLTPEQSKQLTLEQHRAGGNDVLVVGSRTYNKKQRLEQIASETDEGTRLIEAANRSRSLLRSLADRGKIHLTDEKPKTLVDILPEFDF